MISEYNRVVLKIGGLDGMVQLSGLFEVEDFNPDGSTTKDQVTFLGARPGLL